MSNSVMDISHKHGQQMYILGLEHAINMIELSGVDVLPRLQDRLAQEKLTLANLEHSRFNPEHYKNCDSCYQDHLDLEDEQKNDNQEDK